MNPTVSLQHVSSANGQTNECSGTQATVLYHMNGGNDTFLGSTLQIFSAQQTQIFVRAAFALGRAVFGNTRKADLKGRALGGLTVHANLTTVSLGDPATDRQSKA